MRLAVRDGWLFSFIGGCVLFSRKMVVSAGIKVAQHWKIIPIFVVISIPQANVDAWVKSQK